MKKFTELSDVEILDLTEEDIRKHIDLACAERGIPLKMDLPPKPEKVHHQGDVECWIVGDILFDNRESAQAAASHLNSLPGRVRSMYLSGPGFQSRVEAALADIEIQTKRYWTEDAWRTVREEVSFATQAMKDWEALETQAREIDNQREDVISEIREAIDQVHGEDRQRKYWAAELQRYLDLGLDETHARSALLLAAPRAEKYLPEVEAVAMADKAVDGGADR